VFVEGGVYAMAQWHNGQPKPPRVYTTRSIIIIIIIIIIINHTCPLRNLSVLSYNVYCASGCVVVAWCIWIYKHFKTLLKT